MALPAKLNAYSYSVANRVVYASLVQVARETMFLIKNHLKTVGYTVKGSCNGVVGAMDGVDRWATAADAGTRFNGTAGAQSWIVLRSAENHDILFTFNSAADDIFKIAVSFQGDYAAAGTPAQQPTSANEQLVNTFFTVASVASIVGNTAAGDRIVNVWARTDAKGFRFAIARAGSWVCAGWVEKHDLISAISPSVTVSSAHAGFIGTVSTLVASNLLIGAASGSSGSGAVNLRARVSIGANLAQCCFTTECQGSIGGAANSDNGQAYAPEIYGGVEYVSKRLGIASLLAAARGKIANVRDMWVGRSAGIIDGDTFGNREFISLGLSGLVWPWNGTSSVPGTSVVMN